MLEAAQLLVSFGDGFGIGEEILGLTHGSAGWGSGPDRDRRRPVRSGFRGLRAWLYASGCCRSGGAWSWRRCGCWAAGRLAGWDLEELGLPVEGDRAPAAPAAPAAGAAEEGGRVSLGGLEDWLAAGRRGVVGEEVLLDWAAAPPEEARRGGEEAPAGRRVGIWRPAAGLALGAGGELGPRVREIHC